MKTHVDRERELGVEIQLFEGRVAKAEGLLDGGEESGLAEAWHLLASVRSGLVGNGIGDLCDVYASDRDGLRRRVFAAQGRVDSGIFALDVEKLGLE